MMIEDEISDLFIYGVDQFIHKGKFIDTFFKVSLYFGFCLNLSRRIQSTLSIQYIAGY